MYTMFNSRQTFSQNNFDNSSMRLQFNYVSDTKQTCLPNHRISKISQTEITLVTITHITGHSFYKSFLYTPMGVGVGEKVGLRIQGPHVRRFVVGLVTL